MSYLGLVVCRICVTVFNPFRARMNKGFLNKTVLQCKKFGKLLNLSQAVVREIHDVSWYFVFVYSTTLGSLLASLAHTRAGIPDAMITSGAVDILIGHLNSENVEVRCSSAVALGYLTFNRTATRLLLIATRNTPGLFQRLMENLDKDGKISKDFTEEFKRQEIVGLPALR